MLHHQPCPKDDTFQSQKWLYNHKCLLICPFIWQLHFKFIFHFVTFNPIPTTQGCFYPCDSKVLKIKLSATILQISIAKVISLGWKQPCKVVLLRFLWGRNSVKQGMVTFGLLELVLDNVCIESCDLSDNDVITFLIVHNCRKVMRKTVKNFQSKRK